VIRKIFVVLLALGMAAGGSLTGTAGKSGGNQAVALTGSSSAPVAEALPPRELTSLLPDSDAVVLVDLQKVLEELLPRLFANRPDKMAEINAYVDQIKTKTGIDLRSFQSIAAGARYVPVAGKPTTVKTVVLARGTFNAAGMVAAVRIAANGKMRDVDYHGKKIAVISLADLKTQAATAAGSVPGNVPGAGIATKVLGQLIDGQAGELAMVALDQNTLALGDLERVQSTLDGKRTSAANAAMIALAQRTPGAIIGLGGNMPADLSKQLDVGIDQISKNLDSIRQAYGAVTYSADSYQLFIGAKTGAPAAAKDLSDSIEGLKIIGGMFIGQIRDENKSKLAQRGLDNLKVTQSGNEVQMQLAVSQSDAAQLVDMWK
jgi:hypothetical protein